MSRQFQGSLGPLHDLEAKPARRAELPNFSARGTPHCRSHAIWEWLATDGLAWLIVAALWGAFSWLVLR